MTKGLRDGRLARAGLYGAEEIAAAQKLLDRLDRDRIETVRVLFPDQHGILRGKTVVASALASVLANGMNAPSTLLLKDTSHRTVFPVWSRDAGVGAAPMHGVSDILLRPDPATFRPLPWAPGAAWILCNAHHKDATTLPFDARSVLARAIALLADEGLALTIGLEIEFHVFEVTDEAREHGDTAMPGTPPATRPLSHGYQLLTDTRYGEWHPVMELLRENAQGLGLPLRSMEVEMGPSQAEFTFDAGDPMAQADTMVMFRTMVKQVCADEGLHASFMAKPRLPNAAAIGWHIHQSLSDLDTGANLFMPRPGHDLTDTAGAWLAGLLAHAGESCLLTTPTINGYKRFQPYQLAPNKVQWGHDNRGAMVRALTRAGDPAARLENRVPEPAANPYYAIAAQILSGLSGIKAGMSAPPPIEEPYDDPASALPAHLGEALDAFEEGRLYRNILGDGFADYLSRIKRAEWDRYLAAISEWEQAEYFRNF